MADEALFDKIIITDSLTEIASDKMDGYLTHALCLDGNMEFVFNGKRLTFGDDSPQGWTCREYVRL
jgi:hypothetical protein